MNKPNPKNFSNFKSYANAVRQWYTNKPYNVTNSVNVFTNALRNYYKNRAGPSNVNSVIARELSKLYGSPSISMRTKLQPPVNKRHRLHARSFEIQRDLLKNSLRRMIMNERAIQLLTGPPENKGNRGANARMHAMKMGPVVNSLRRAMKTIFTNTGMYTGPNKRYLVLRKPNGSTVFMNRKGTWRPYTNQTSLHYTKLPGFDTKSITRPLINLTAWRNVNGSVWIFVDGKWHKVKLNK